MSSMDDVHDQFSANIDRVKNLSSLYKSISEQSYPILDLSDILRSCIVLLVSALDHYIHEIILIGMIEVLSGDRPVTPKFSKFPVPLECIQASEYKLSIEVLAEEVRRQHSYKSFQSPENIADGLKLFCNESDIWRQISDRMERGNSRRVKESLKLLIKRRNQIAHEADIDPTYGTGRRWPIDMITVDHEIEFIEELVYAIHEIIKI